MAMPMRIKTVWFKKEGHERSPDEIATVIAATLWRVADKAVDNLSKAQYDIITSERGFRIIGEFVAFLVHYCDRLAHGSLAPERRAAVMQAIAVRVAEIMEDNIRTVVGPDGFDYKQNFIDMMNRRMADYAEFEFPEDRASFQALRFMGLQIRDIMDREDQMWIMDQVMDIEMPEMLGGAKKSFEGLLSSAPVKRGFGSADALPPE
jgi:hypothetical protein